MKNYNLRIFIFLLLTTSAIFSSCYKESSWMDDNITYSGNKYPLVQKVKLDKSTYDAGETVTVLVNYFSVDEIDRLDLYASIAGAAEELISSTPNPPSVYDAANYNQQTTLQYTVSGTSGQKITLRAVIVTKAGLTSKEEHTTQKYGYDKATLTVN